jgi:hypothetical protein
VPSGVHCVYQDGTHKTHKIAASSSRRRTSEANDYGCIRIDLSRAKVRRCLTIASYLLFVGTTAPASRAAHEPVLSLATSG